MSDTDRSLSLYRDTLGFKVAGGAENFGVEQEHLNQVFGARLQITALRAAKGPGVEFLEYITPPGGRQLPADAQVNDLLAWTTALRTNDTASTISTAESAGARRASILGESVLLRDPDGHLLQISP